MPQKCLIGQACVAVWQMETLANCHSRGPKIDACKTGSRTGSNFQYAGPFTEIVLLGNVAYRVGKAITYDPKSMRITDVSEANELLSKDYRKGWEV